MSKYNKWSDAERTLLLNYVVDGIQTGKKIVELIASFADTYGITAASASNQWQSLAKENELMVAIAKQTWKSVVKPEMEAKAKAEKAEARLAAKVKRETEKSRAKWRKDRAKLEAQREKVRLTTNRTIASSVRAVYTVDANGLVIGVNNVVSQ